MDDIKVLVADNSLVYKKMITQGVKEVNDNSSVIYAADGDEAVRLIKRNNYDVIIIDAEISGLGLLELLKVIKVNLPRAFVLVMVRPSSAHDKLFTEAISKGATECMVKPIYDSYSDNLEIIKRKITDINKTLREDFGKKEAAKKIEPVPLPVIVKEPDKEIRLCPDIVLIAASTGGPFALEAIMSQIREDFSVPILIVQHIPSNFTENLAKNLNHKSKITIKVAEHKETIAAGTAYIAPGGAHMKLDARNRIILDDSPPRGGIRPAADVLFESVAESYPGDKVLAVILTGMGSDGRDGLIKLKEKKECYCLSQSEKTCVVYGMPRAVAEEGLTDKVLDLDKISSEIESLIFSEIKS